MRQRIQSHRMSALPTVGAWTEAVETSIRAHAAFLHEEDKIDSSEDVRSERITDIIISVEVIAIGTQTQASSIVVVEDEACSTCLAIVFRRSFTAATTWMAWNTSFVVRVITIGTLIKALAVEENQG